jgi:hypothetical protein
MELTFTVIKVKTQTPMMLKMLVVKSEKEFVEKLALLKIILWLAMLLFCL